MSTFNQNLIHLIKRKKNNLCVGIDPDMDLIPEGYKKNFEGMKKYIQDIIEFTFDFCIAYKINFAFFECLGSKGLVLLEEILDFFESIFNYQQYRKILIADAKRGDIENTSRKYAKAFFEIWNFDAITIQPYMGYDSLFPFLEYKNKGTIVLLITSNPSNRDIQFYGTPPVYERIIELGKVWNQYDNLLYVVGATLPEEILARISFLEKKAPLLIPGIGAQKGNLDLVMKYFSERAIINISRSILYASSDKNHIRKILINKL